MSEIFQVKQLVIPLCDDSEGILDKGDDDQKSTYGGEISWKGQYRLLLVDHRKRWLYSSINSRLQRLSDIVQKVFNLASLLSELI